ncbi:MAG: Hpt domain-containing protein [Desulfurivibrionaceae bacterium]|nr:Hpt domain-containing protein [Desulfurivibrionaceae bacterium]
MKISEDQALPPQLPGIDLAETMERTGISAEMLRPILRKFAVKNRERGAEMAALLSKGDLQGLTMAAHRLKGASANIGATALPQACLAVERAIAQGKDGKEIQGLLHELAGALAVLLNSLAALQ